MSVASNSAEAIAPALDPGRNKESDGVGVVAERGIQFRLTICQLDPQYKSLRRVDDLPIGDDIYGNRGNSANDDEK